MLAANDVAPALGAIALPATATARTEWFAGHRVLLHRHRSGALMGSDRLIDLVRWRWWAGVGVASVVKYRPWGGYRSQQIAENLYLQVGDLRRDRQFRTTVRSR